MEREEVEKALEEAQVAGETILTIKTRPLTKIAEDESGVELNEGYDFEVNGAIPQLADAIVKLALAMPDNGFGKGSDKGFIVLINEFFNRARQEK